MEIEGECTVSRDSRQVEIELAIRNVGEQLVHQVTASLRGSGSGDASLFVQEWPREIDVFAPDEQRHSRWKAELFGSGTIHVTIVIQARNQAGELVGAGPIHCPPIEVSGAEATPTGSPVSPSPTSTRTPSPPPPTPMPCFGDFNGDRLVSISELVGLVRCVIDPIPSDVCSAEWQIADLVRAVGNALRNCEPETVWVHYIVCRSCEGGPFCLGGLNISGGVDAVFDAFLPSGTPVLETDVQLVFSPLTVCGVSEGPVVNILVYEHDTPPLIESVWSRGRLDGDPDRIATSFDSRVSWAGR